MRKLYFVSWLSIISLLGSIFLSGCNTTPALQHSPNPTKLTVPPSKSSTENTEKTTPSDSTVQNDVYGTSKGKSDQTQDSKAITKNNEDLVVYKGPIEHIFFHPLIAYPSRAFDHGSLSKGYNDWFVTVKEFKKILPSLYKNNFILIGIRSLYDTKVENGKIVIIKKQLLLPKGKQPLILSIDDMNYYDYMIHNGNVFKLILDSHGDIATYSVNPQGETVISHDNEIIPIVDAFVKEHPDFSFQGSKGIIALTGYEGILGYRTNEIHSAQYEKTKQAVLPVIQRLKQTGWLFASHGYGHLHDRKISYTHFVQDTNHWLKEVAPIIGPTPIYIYPFGSRVPTNGAKYKFLVKSGFQVFCSVGPTPYMKYMPDAVMMDRRHIDGMSLHSQGKRLMKFFDSSKIIDPIRPSQY